MVTEERLDSFAADLAPRLLNLVDTVEARERRSRPVVKVEEMPEPIMAKAPCRKSTLDFISRPGPKHSEPITAKWSAKFGEKLHSQLALCLRCTIREECLALALDLREMVGVWGGTLPHERKAMLKEFDDV